MNVLARLTPEQRAAVVLVSLNPEQAKPLAEQLGLPAMRRIQAALSNLPHLSEQEVLAAFAEFIAQLSQWKSGLRGGEAQSFDLLTKALGDALVEEIRVTSQQTETETSVWKEFAKISSKVIAEYLGQQHGSVAAVMLKQLPQDRVPEILSLMPLETAVETIGQMSRAEDPAPEAKLVAEQMIKLDLLGSAADPMNDPKVIMIGETLGTLPRALRDAALNRLEEEDEARAAAIKSTLLRIEDLPQRVPTKSVQVLFRELSRDMLVEGLAAIRATSPEVSEFLLGNIAQRMADQFRESMSELSEMGEVEQDRAIGNLVREILGMSRRGTLTLLPVPSE
jgi:flagellar motor switch protein FliG